MNEIQQLAIQVLEKARAQGVRIATAESCTGGMIAAALTDIAGSSDVFDRGFVTYSNKAKHDMLGVDPDTLSISGAVSEQTATAMAIGAIDNSQATLSISVTGIAGPGGGSIEKPVGTVWFATHFRGRTEAHHEQFHDEGRARIRSAAALKGLQLLLSRISA